MAEAEPLPVLWTPPSVLADLKARAAAAYPFECCGLLVGCPMAPGDEGPKVSRMVPTANHAANPRRAFEVDPAAHIALLRTLRAQAKEGRQPVEQVIGHYHSHPDAPAVPSARDQAQAMEPGLIWLIVAASLSGAGEIRAWRAIRDGDGAIGFQPMNLIFL